MPAAESERIISLLKSAIRLSNHTYRDVERQLGWRVGTVTRLMRGGLGLKIEHLLGILRVIGFSPGRFFAAACPAEAAAGPTEDRLYRMLVQMYGEERDLGRPPHARAGGGGLGQGSAAAAMGVAGVPGAAGAVAVTSQDQIDDMVRESLRKLIGLPGPAAGGDP